MSDTVPETEIPEIPQEAAEAEAGAKAELAVEPVEPVEPVAAVETAEAVEPEYDPAAPAPLNIPRTLTGNADVDAQLERLGDADHLATDGHVEVYEDVHRGLRDALTALDARPGPPAPPSMPGMRS
ncbi:hypothetical protein [Streptomyces sp. AC550_RSS872]|uniref:hypothetical protein n=1 Tax=Streptomyces sp. AC550_RSS872 TaxID=2823689 RepID=UPI001C27957B|nr:hypothetical protein [Streptomyces sp. AC550_RSS872]